MPFATLHHWDVPQALQNKGGWLNRDSIEWFAEYARVILDRFGDRVRWWNTFNEPWCIAFLGYATGQHAPGLCDYSKAYQVAHHVLMAHGNAVRVFRQSGLSGQIGIILNPQRFVAASDSEQDRMACQLAYEENTALFLDALYMKRYPESLFSVIGSHQPRVQSGDMDLIAEPTDYLGVNYYVTHQISHSVLAPMLKANAPTISDPGFGRTTMDWGIAPSGLTPMLLNIQQTYHPNQILITENGCALPDAPDDSGYVADHARIVFLREHLKSAHAALQAGVNIKGYFAWSLMDNFEWALGYEPRFGLIRVDFKTGQRIPKMSASWYRDVIKQNGLAL
jgi:beta-glucosidase